MTEIGILERILRWFEEGLGCEASDKHRRALLEAMGFQRVGEDRQQRRCQARGDGFKRKTPPCWIKWRPSKSVDGSDVRGDVFWNVANPTQGVERDCRKGRHCE